MAAREFAEVTLRGVPYLADVSRDNPGELFVSAGDDIATLDAHVRLYERGTRRLAGVYCGHEDDIEPRMVARNGTVYCPHSQLREPCQ